MDTEQRERFARAAEDLVTELDRLSNMLHLAGMGELSSAHAGNRICSGCSIANRAVGLPANFNNAESWG